METTKIHKENEKCHLKTLKKVKEIGVNIKKHSEKNKIPL